MKMDSIIVLTGRTCTHALLFAQLITPDGTNHGLHGFVVPIRDPATLETYPGLIVGDMGEKIGVHGIDNGTGYHGENLLNRSADVTEEGVYESKFSEPSRILGAALENLSAGRIGIMQESCNSISSAVCIAIRYAATRQQFGTAAQEIPLIEYQLHQWRLFGYVAASVVFKLYIQNMTQVYLKVVEKSNSGQKLDNLAKSETVSEIHAMVSSSKPMMTWTVLRAAQQCREACGGHGFLKRANLGDIRSNHEATVTYEGDNSVLCQQAGNWLLRQYGAACAAQPVDSPLGTVAFLQRGEDILAEKFQARASDDLKTTEINCEFVIVIHYPYLGVRCQILLRSQPVYQTIHIILSTYRWLLCYLLKETHDQYQSLIASGLTKFHAKAKTQVYKWQTLTQVYAEYLALMFSLESIGRKEKDLQPVLEKQFLLYGLWSLDRHLVELYQGGFAQGEGLAKLLRRAVLELCSDVKNEVVSIVDALGPTDFVLNSVLGKSDGKLYQNLQKEFFHNPGGLQRATWWRDVVPSKL
ncbi:hypothetical protein MSG28_003160 [Choristoneura fumiferana]|uniref:Uncharacterized protein n=1 Tax=Choristoneura fumiferana TaxID=7141 RepID=A0ACC0KET8_CHOFU|nr:hypothetical protein MSG28_003160 [Choristoneura fumiferana]